MRSCNIIAISAEQKVEKLELAPVTCEENISCEEDINEPFLLEVTTKVY
ncbi:unnamed protein product [Brassica oleracea var. botrytis]